jgi:FkbM family methyltransferase
MGRSLLDLLAPPARVLIRRYGTARYLYDLVETLDEDAQDRSSLRMAPSYRGLRQSPLVYVDVGARGGLDRRLDPFREVLRPVLFEPDPAEYARLSATLADTDATVIPAAAGARRERRMVHLTKKRGNSSLLPPNGSAIGLTAIEGEGLGRFEVEAMAEVEVRPLGDCLDELGIRAEILKIDTQGFEWEVLQGLGDHLPHVVVAECATTEIYAGQTSLWRIGLHLEQLGYFAVRFMRRHAVPAVGIRHRASLQLYGDVTFVPSLSPAGRANIERAPERWFACLCLHGLSDLAVWQATELGLLDTPLIAETLRISSSRGR